MNKEQQPFDALAEEFGSFLYKTYPVGDAKARMAFFQSPEFRELNTKYPMTDPQRISEEDLTRVFELMGPHYGAEMQVPDMKDMLRLALPHIKDRKTLSIGSGLAPHELFLASKGLITKEIVATDMIPSLLERAKEISNDLGITNISFKQQRGDELDYKEEFGQVLAFDSLHWMRTWRTCLKKGAEALSEEGTFIIGYSRFSPRIQISELDAVSELSKLGMDVVDARGMKSKAGTPRVFISAIKRKPEGLFVPNSSAA